jgi:hypothetical protein
MLPPAARHGATVPNPHLQETTGRSPVQPHVQRVPARSPGAAAWYPVRAARRHGGALVPAQRARREGQHTNIPAQANTARRPDPYPFLARRQRRPRAQAAQELPPSRYGNLAARRPATRQESTTARLDVAVHHRKETKGEKREGGCGAHDGAMVESWPARWRGVRRRGRGSRRWSPPRLLLLVPSWSSPFPLLARLGAPWR